VKLKKLRADTALMIERTQKRAGCFKMAAAATMNAEALKYNLGLNA